MAPCTSSSCAETVLAKLGLLGPASASMPTTPQGKLGSCIGSPSGRQLSQPAKVDHELRSACPQLAEPAKIDLASSAIDLLDMPPGLCVGRQTAKPKPGPIVRPPGLLDVAEEAARRLSEPLKVSIGNLKYKVPNRPAELADDDEEEDPATTPSTRSGSGSVRTLELPSCPTSPVVGQQLEPQPRVPESPIYSTSPVRGPQSDASLRYVAESPIFATSPAFNAQSEAMINGWFGQEQAAGFFPETWNTGALTVMMPCIPNEYTEENLLEELKDGGFKHTRDFDFFALDLDSGSFVVNFVDASTMRSFTAAFDGREMRLASGRVFETEVFLS